MGSIAFAASSLGYFQGHSTTAASDLPHAEDGALVPFATDPSESVGDVGLGAGARHGAADSPLSSGPSGPASTGLFPAPELAEKGHPHQQQALQGALTMRAMARPRGLMPLNGSSSGAGKSAQASENSAQRDLKADEEQAQVAFVPERIHHHYLQLVYREHLSEYEYEWLERWLE